MDFSNIQNHGNNKWYLYIAGLILIFICNGIFQIPFFIAAEKYGIEAPMRLAIPKNMNLALLLFTFVGAVLGLFLAVRYLHRRKLKTLFTGNSKFNYTRFFKAMLIYFSLAIFMEIISSLTGDTHMEFNFNPAGFAILFLVCIILIPFQAGFEELLFRAYLFQGANLMVKNKVVSVIICGTIFGLMHITNPEVKEHGILSTMPSYIYMGIFFGLLVLIDNGLERALAVHIANNLYGTIIVTFPESALPTDALFTMEKVDPNTAFVGILIVTISFLFVSHGNDTLKTVKKAIQTH